MVRPHNARRPFYREFRQNTNPADPEDPNVHNPEDPNVVHPPANQINPSANAHLYAGQSEAALHQHQPPRSASRKQKKNKKARVINNYYLSCAHDSVSVLPHPPQPVSNPAPSSTPSASSGGSTRKIPALMSLQLTKPVGYSFASNYVQGRIAKADSAKEALAKAGTSKGPSQDKARATPCQAKAKVVSTTPNHSTLVSPLKLVLWGSSHLTEYHGLPAAIKQDIQFAAVLNKSRGGES
jgi:hypothetical protein